MKNMEKVEYLWKKFEEYKDRAEQHEFFQLFILDSKLGPAYKDLQTNYTDEHAEMFIRALSKVLTQLGVDISQGDDNENHT